MRDRLRPFLVPTLTVMLSCQVAFCASDGKIDFTEFVTLGTAFFAFLLVIGVIACAGGLVMTIFKLMGGDWGRAIMYGLACLAGGLLVAYAKPWAMQLTGQSF